MKARHLLLTTGLLFFAATCFAVLSLDSVSPNQGPLGEAWTANLSGSDFDDQLYLSTYPDPTTQIPSEYSLTLPGLTYGVAVSNDVAYVGTDGGDIHIVDVSDPTRPQLIGSINVLLHCGELEISGNYLYAATTDYRQVSDEWESRLFVIDISIPRQPRILGSVEADGFVNLAVAGHMVYLAGSTVQVVDASRPNAPVVVGGIDTPMVALCIAVSGDRLVVDGGMNSIYCIDVSDPHSPRLIGSISNNEFNRRPQDFAVSDGYILATDWKDLTVLDVHGSSPIAEVGRVRTSDARTHKIAVSDDMACMTGAHDLIYIFDIADPQKPKLLGHIDQSDQFTAMTLSGQYIYAADFSGLKIFDSNAMNPVGVIGHVYTRLGNSALAVHAGKIYCAGKELYVIDGATQRVEHTISLGQGQTLKVFVSDDRILVVTEDGLYPLSHLASGKPVLGRFNSFDELEQAYMSWQSVVMVDDYVYLLDGESLKIFTIRDIYDLPAVVGETVVPGTTIYASRLLGVHQNKAYLSAGSPGDNNILVVDVEDRSNPVFDTTLTFPLESDTSIYSMTADGDKLTFVEARYIPPVPYGGGSFYMLNGFFRMHPNGTIEEIDLADTPGLPYGELLRDIPIYDDIAYLAQGSTDPVIALDLANQPHPAIVGTLVQLAGTSLSDENFIVSGIVGYLPHENYGLLMLPLPARAVILSVNDSTDLLVELPPSPMPGRYTVSAYNGEDTIELRSAFEILPGPSSGDGDGSSSGSGCFVQTMLE